MPKYLHPNDRRRIESRGVAQRLQTIDAKLGFLVDKEWDAIDTGDVERLAQIRRELEEMMGRYR